MLYTCPGAAGAPASTPSAQIVVLRLGGAPASPHISSKPSFGLGAKCRPPAQCESWCAGGGTSTRPLHWPEPPLPKSSFGNWAVDRPALTSGANRRFETPAHQPNVRDGVGLAPQRGPCTERMPSKVDICTRFLQKDLPLPTAWRGGGRRLCEVTLAMPEWNLWVGGGGWLNAAGALVWAVGAPKPAIDRIRHK